LNGVKLSYLSRRRWASDTLMATDFRTPEIPHRSKKVIEKSQRVSDYLL